MSGEPGSTFIRWKGTDVCMDVICLCGNGHHIDGYFAYAFECPDCGKTMVLGSQVSVREDTTGEHIGKALKRDPDDEDGAWSL